jgi:hypothetical protein
MLVSTLKVTNLDFQDSARLQRAPLSRVFATHDDKMRYSFLPQATARFDFSQMPVFIPD